MDTKKQAICDALRVWINQRPGLEPGNYISHGMDAEGRKAYFSESRRIQRQRRDALTLLRAVELRDSISGDDLEAAFPRAFSGRLTCTVESWADDCDRGANYEAKIDYCTGQYWPTEYRAAAAAVLASALWDWMRENMPAPNSWRVESWGAWNGSIFDKETSKPLEIHAACELLAEKGGQAYGHVQEYYGGKSGGDWLRQSFRREFGRTMQERYFN